MSRKYKYKFSITTVSDVHFFQNLTLFHDMRLFFKCANGIRTHTDGYGSVGVVEQGHKEPMKFKSSRMRITILSLSEIVCTLMMIRNVDKL